MRRSILIVPALLLIAAILILSDTAVRALAQRSVATTPRTGGVLHIVSATSFELARECEHAWRAEAPHYRAGWLLVLDVEPELVHPRQTAEPVLYGGSETLERVNHGYESGRVIAILPATAGALPDLARTPFWFGDADLPERVDATQVAVELKSALRHGVRPFTPAEIQAALARGGPAIAVTERSDLDEQIGLLVLEHAPEEHDLGLGLLVPRTR